MRIEVLIDPDLSHDQSGKEVMIDPDRNMD